MKHELLAPAGNMESLKYAVQNGADAIYMAAKNFGARKFANNFTNEEIIEAIKYCHLYGVKVYITMNTLVKNNEVEDFLKQVEFLHKNGVDAILMQDFGMINLCREKYPNLEIHASTQANTSAKETAELFYKLGLKRVVFSREMSLEEINSIAVPIEKEVFVHGALCISYSGCCLMSSMIGTRSGNRGECAGSCRLPYQLLHKGKQLTNKKYLLSTKELNTSTRFNELLNSDITSFKIEGRMKSPEYVGFITNYYRNLIDKYEQTNIKEKNNELKTIFNREFTTGHLFNCSPKDLMNIESPNHIGLEIGKVIGITKDKIKIKLSKPLNQQDGIRFKKSGKGFIVNYLYDENKKLISSANNICYLDNKVDLKENDIVCKTLDFKLMKDLKNLPKRKLEININIKAKENENIEMEILDGTNKINVKGPIIEKAQNNPITEDTISRQILKLGETPFTCKKININISDNIFIPIKVLNELRREAVNKLINVRENTKKEVIIKETKFTKTNINKTNYTTATVYNENQLKECIDKNIDRIYVIKKSIYKKYKHYENIYYVTPRCSRKISKNLEDKNLVSDYFNFINQNLVGNYGLNVYNIYTAYYLFKYNLKSITLSVELTEKEIEEFIKMYQDKFGNNYNFEILVYGRVENMIIKDNILNLQEDDINYELQDLKQRKFPVYYDSYNTHVLNYEPKKLNISKFIKENCNLRIDFYNEENIEKYLKNY